MSKLGVELVGATFAIGKALKFNFSIEKTDDFAFTVDRNYICGALARYLTEHFDAPAFKSLYETNALYVDAETKIVMVRTSGTIEGAAIQTIPYDLIIGCDGIRSIVRNAFITNHRGKLVFFGKLHSL